MLTHMDISYKWCVSAFKLISSCNCTGSSTITEEIQTSKFKAKKSKEPLGRVLIFAFHIGCGKLPNFLK